MAGKLPKIALALALVATAFGRARAEEQHVVVISIDGLPHFYLDDPKASLPALRGLIARGAVSKDGMVVSNPSVTWPNHTTMMTGVHPESHGVIFNAVLERQGVGQPTKSNGAKTQAELVRGPMIFDTLKAAGKESAAINWPCTRESASIADNMPDVPGMLGVTTPRLKQELESAGLLEGFEGSPGTNRDKVWVEATNRTLKNHKPSLLALHVLNLDSTHHRFGPRSAEGYEAATFADGLVAQVLDGIEAAGLKDSTTVFVVSDHGFITTPKNIRPNALLRKAGLLEADEKGAVTKARVHVISEGGIGLVYLTDPATAKEDAEAVRALMKDVEGVAAILGPDDFPRYHLPKPDAYRPMADLVIACKFGYSVGGSADGDEAVVTSKGTPGTHGFLSTEPDMQAVFIAAGPGIAPGTKLEGVQNVDLSPAIAKILGITLPRADGHVPAGLFTGK